MPVARIRSLNFLYKILPVHTRAFFQSAPTLFCDNLKEMNLTQLVQGSIPCWPTRNNTELLKTISSSVFSWWDSGWDFSKTSLPGKANLLVTQCSLEGPGWKLLHAAFPNFSVTRSSAFLSSAKIEIDAAGRRQAYRKSCAGFLACLHQDVAAHCRRYELG